MVHTLKTTEALLQFYQKDLAPSESARNTWIPDLNKDGSRDIRDLTELKERVVRIQDTNGDGVADTSRVMKEGFSEDPTWDVGGGILAHGGDLFFGMAPGVYRLHDANGDGVIDRQTTDQRRLQHAHGVRRPRRLRRHARSRRTALLGSRRHRLQRRRQEPASDGPTRVRAPCCAPSWTAATSRSSRRASGTCRSSRSTSTAT